MKDIQLNLWLESLKTTGRPNMDEAIKYLGDLFPLLKEFKNTIQDPVWHAEGNVHIHTDMVLEELYKIFDQEYTPTEYDRQILILAAILHDIAKPITTHTCKETGRVKASGHESKGKDYLVFRLINLDIEFSSYRQIINLVGYHQRPKLLVIKDDPDYKYLALTHYFNYELMYWLEMADLRGRTCDDKEDTIMYLDEYLFKTQEILKRVSEDKKSYRPETHVESKWSKHLLRTGQINSLLEAPAKLYDKLQSDKFFKFVLMCGIPGVGKSTTIKKYYSNYQVISMDDIRAEFGSRQDQSNNKQVAVIAKERLKEAFRKKQNVIWDATSIRKDHRAELLTLAENYGAYTELLLLLDTEKNIRKKNSERQFAVPDSVISKMMSNFQYPTPDEAVSVLIVNIDKLPLS